MAAGVAARAVTEHLRRRVVELALVVSESRPARMARIGAARTHAHRSLRRLHATDLLVPILAALSTRRLLPRLLRRREVAARRDPAESRRLLLRRSETARRLPIVVRVDPAPWEHDPTHTWRGSAHRRAGHAIRPHRRAGLHVDEVHRRSVAVRSRPSGYHTTRSARRAVWSVSAAAVGHHPVSWMMRVAEVLLRQAAATIGEDAGRPHTWMTHPAIHRTDTRGARWAAKAAAAWPRRPTASRRPSTETARPSTETASKRRHARWAEAVSWPLVVASLASLGATPLARKVLVD